MKLTTPQRNLLLLGMVFAIALLPLMGSLHHHDHHDDAMGGCWFCTTASIAILPFHLVLLALALVALASFATCDMAPSRLLWAVRHRRGPPVDSFA